MRCCVASDYAFSCDWNGNWWWNPHGIHERKGRCGTGCARQGERNHGAAAVELGNAGDNGQGTNSHKAAQLPRWAQKLFHGTKLAKYKARRAQFTIMNTNCCLSDAKYAFSGEQQSPGTTGRPTDPLGGSTLVSIMCSARFTIVFGRRPRAERPEHGQKHGIITRFNAVFIDIS